MYNVRLQLIGRVTVNKRAGGEENIHQNLLDCVISEKELIFCLVPVSALEACIVIISRKCMYPARLENTEGFRFTGAPCSDIAIAFVGSRENFFPAPVFLDLPKDTVFNFLHLWICHS